MRSRRQRWDDESIGLWLGHRVELRGHSIAHELLDVAHRQASIQDLVGQLFLQISVGCGQQGACVACGQTPIGNHALERWGS